MVRLFNTKQESIRTSHSYDNKKHINQTTAMKNVRVKDDNSKKKGLHIKNIFLVDGKQSADKQKSTGYRGKNNGNKDATRENKAHHSVKEKQITFLNFTITKNPCEFPHFMTYIKSFKNVHMTRIRIIVGILLIILLLSQAISTFSPYWLHQNTVFSQGLWRVCTETTSNNVECMRYTTLPGKQVKLVLLF